MRKTTNRTASEPGWEKEFAPRITRGHVFAAFAVYGLWIAFLAVLAGRHWLGQMQ